MPYAWSAPSGGSRRVALACQASAGADDLPVRREVVVPRCQTGESGHAWSPATASPRERSGGARSHTSQGVGFPSGTAQSPGRGSQEASRTEVRDATSREMTRSGSALQREVRLDPPVSGACSSSRLGSTGADLPSVQTLGVDLPPRDPLARRLPCGALQPLPDPATRTTPRRLLARPQRSPCVCFGAHHSLRHAVRLGEWCTRVPIAKPRGSRENARARSPRE